MSDISNLDNYFPEMSSRLKNQYERFFELVEKYNSKINLVSKSSLTKASIKHFADCIMGLELIENDFVPNQPILDFGSGNGFPGIIAALMFWDRPVILVERDLRKSEFLKTAVDFLALKNCEIHTGSVSELSQGSCYNVISRAMAPLPKFLLEARPVMASGGSAFMFKGDHWSTEFTAIPAQLFEYWDVDLHGHYELPEDEGSRYIVRCTRL